MIKVAVLSDIHGNLDALNEVIKDIKKRNINRLLLLGDYAIMGPEPNETVSFVQNLSKDFETDIIQGNTDLFVVADELPNLPEFALNAIEYSRKTLSEENFQYLKNLPAIKSIKIGQTSILMTHGSPRKNDENIFPGEDISTIKPMITGVQENLILCGHTHLPAGYQIEKQTVVNVGSVGRPFTENQKACYVILEIDEAKKDTFSVEHIFIPFDAKICAEKIEKQNFEGANYLAELMLQSVAKLD